MPSAFRTEYDTMGEMQVPASALYGAQTQRAVENFPISGLRFNRGFIRALGLIKAAAAKTNAALGQLPPTLAAAIHTAAEEVADGRYDGQFVIDMFQTGSGTSTNMNVNEVIARRAGDIVGDGTRIHPNDQVNLSQSSNDVFPTAIHLAASETVHRNLFPAMEALHQALAGKAEQFWNILKIGRTHLQDAVPMRLGQEFRAYARQVESNRGRIAAALDGILELPLGGTAVGSGLNAPKGFAASVIKQLAETTGLRFREARDHFEAQASKDAVAFLSSALKTYALALTKIANDIRWLASGPRCGLGEIRLPEVQPGSSIMPGKVNPVIAESLLMVCAQVIGNDTSIAWCCAAGNFELNTMMPLMAYNLLQSVELLASGSKNFAERCVAGIEANQDRLNDLLERSLALCTALTPEIGYERAASLAKKAASTGRTIREIAEADGSIPKDRLAQLLDPWTMVGGND
ncbi:MAG: class II fumarate hydratase [Bryobacterales bacterium]|nr:class II fumarate hydratase [Bryobacterales bacterium]MBV9400333.1 class II fumarate hydratase [Bryobacterales bacterium]